MAQVLALQVELEKYKDTEYSFDAQVVYYTPSDDKPENLPDFADWKRDVKEILDRHSDQYLKGKYKKTKALGAAVRGLVKSGRKDSLLDAWQSLCYPKDYSIKASFETIASELIALNEKYSLKIGAVPNTRVLTIHSIDPKVDSTFVFSRTGDTFNLNGASIERTEEAKEKPSSSKKPKGPSAD